MSQSYRTHMFDLSLVGTTVEAFNNIFYTQGDSNFPWVENAGKLNLRGNNLVFGTVNDADDQATSGHYSIQKLGNLINSQPIFVNASSGDLAWLRVQQEEIKPPQPLS